jgi:hypothetical protein
MKPHAPAVSSKKAARMGVDRRRETCNLRATGFFVFNAFNGYVISGPRAFQPACFSYWRYPIVAAKVRCS